MRGMPVLGRAIEQLAPALGASLHDREIVGHERHGGETAESSSGSRTGLPSTRAERLPFPLPPRPPHASSKLEPAAHERGLVAADAHHLGELCARNGRSVQSRWQASRKLVFPWPFGPKSTVVCRPSSIGASARLRKARVLTSSSSTYCFTQMSIGTPAPALLQLVRRRTPRRWLLCLRVTSTGAPGMTFWVPASTRRREGHRFPRRAAFLRIAPVHTALRPMLALGVLPALLPMPTVRGSGRSALGAALGGGREQERCQQEVHSDAHRHDTAVYRPRTRIAGRLQHAGRQLVAELDVHLGRVHDLEHIHQVPSVEADLQAAPLYETGISSFAFAEIGVCEVTLSDLPAARSEPRSCCDRREQAHGASGYRQAGRSTMTVDRLLRITAGSRERAVDQSHHHRDVARRNDARCFVKPSSQARSGPPTAAGAARAALAGTITPALSLNCPSSGRCTMLSRCPSSPPCGRCLRPVSEEDAVQVWCGLVGRDGDCVSRSSRAAR